MCRRKLPEKLNYLQHTNMKFTLPTKAIPATLREPRSLVLYGAPKIGKTTMLSKLPSCLILDIEDGTSYIDAVKIDGFKSMMDVNAACEQIVLAKRPYTFVALDSLSKLEEFAEMSATQSYKQSVMGKSFTGSSVLQLPQGAGYGHLRTEMANARSRIDNTAPRRIYIAHLQEKMIDQKDGTVVSAADLSLTGKIKTITAADVDAIGYMYVKNGTLWVTFKTGGSATCGTRCAHLAGAEFVFDWKKIYPDTLAEISGETGGAM